jgi:shikimate kinase
MSPVAGDPTGVPLRHIVVTGLMGAGKTSVGTAIASRLGWPVRDSDADLLAGTGLTARAYRDELGTDALHEAEKADLLAALAEAGPSVVCAAASVIDDPLARSAMAGPGIVVIWLRALPELLARRFASGDYRPIYGPDPAAVAQAQAEQRDPLFAATAQITVEVDGHDLDQVTAAAMAGLTPWLSSRRPPR